MAPNETNAQAWSPRNRPASNVHRQQRHGPTDYLFWSMMLTINAPNLLMLWGIDTIFKPYRMISLALAFLAIPRIFNQPSSVAQFSRPLFLAIGYVTIMTAVFAGSTAIDQLPMLVTGFALFVAPFVVNSRKSLSIGLYAFVISFILSAYFGLLASESGKFRLSGLFENPNSFGLGGCFAIVILLNGYLNIPRLLKQVLAVATIPILLMTGSRGTLIAAIGGFASQLWRNPALFRGFIIGAICLAMVAYFFDEKAQKILNSNAMFRLTNTDIVEKGAVGRLAQAKAGFIVAAEHGFIGIGLGEYRLKHHTRFFYRRGLDGEVSKLSLHNIYMELLVEWGLVGFLCFGTIIVRLVRSVKHLVYEKDLVYGFLGISLLNGLGNNLLGEIHFWIMLGICVQFVRFAPPARRLVMPRFANNFRSQPIAPQSV